MKFADLEALAKGEWKTIEAEAASVEKALEPEIAMVRAWIAPEEERAAQHLAAILKADGLAALPKIVAAYQQSPSDALKAAVTMLGIMGVDTKNLGVDELQRAIAAIQAQLNPSKPETTNA